MGRRLLVLSVAVSAAIGLAVGGLLYYVDTQAAAQVARAEALLSASLAEAPELDRIQAATAKSLLERAAEWGYWDNHLAGVSDYADALVQLQRGDLVFADGALTSARHRLGWTAELRVLAGEIARRRTNIDEAMEHVNDALMREPECRRGLLLRADILLDRNEAATAARDLRALSELEPDAAVVHNRLGVALLAVGQLDEAEAALRRAAELAPALIDPAINLGRLMRRRGEHGQAFAAFERALALSHADPDAMLGRGLARAALGQLEEAARDFRRAAELAPNDAEPLLALGDLERDLGKSDDAVATYRRALAREDADAASWLKLGNGLILTRDATGALGAFSEALLRAPSLAAAHNGMGAALMHLGRFEEAGRALSRAAELDPSDASPLMNLALLRERAGDRAGARDAWRRALERAPGSEVAERHLARLGG